MCPLPHATDGKQDRPYGAFALSAGWGGDPRPPDQVAAAPPREISPSALLSSHSICGKLPRVGTLNESSTNGPGVAGFGRGLRRGSNRERTGRLAISKGRDTEMKQHIRVFATAGGLLMAMSVTDAAFAQKPGGILRVYQLD